MDAGFGRIERTLLRLALLIAVCVGFSLPLGYSMFSYFDHGSHVRHMAQYDGDRLSELAIKSGSTWETRIEAIGAVLAADFGTEDMFQKTVTSIRTGRVVELGRASCRERVCQSVELSVVAVALKKKTP